jgi:hypothetical protein
MGKGGQARQYMDKFFWIQAMVVAGLAGVAGACLAAAPIYSCIDGHGKRLTSDRPIAECAAKEQRILNPDGSVRQIVPPTMTAEERAEHEARERQAAADRVAQQDAIRRDRNLMIRFPNEAAHNKARNAALDDMRTAVILSEKRLAALAVERKPLIDEAEFYKGKQMPAKLKAQLDGNDAAGDAQRALIQNQQAELGRINALYDVELVRLKKLWAGAPAGSMGVLPVAQAGSGATAKSKSK